MNKRIGFVAFVLTWMFGVLAIVRIGGDATGAAFALIFPAMFFGLLVDAWVNWPQKKDNDS